jgi:hypothetical protein
MSLETELRQALRRKSPSRGFEDRVLSRIATGGAARTRVGTPWWRRASLHIAASVMLALGAAYYLQEQQHRAAEAHAQAARDVVMALQVASETLSAAQAKVEEVTRYEPAKDH